MVQIVAVLGGSDCEWIRTGWLAQPANATSSLAYAVVGAWLLRRVPKPGLPPPMLIAGAVAMVAAGIGSFAFHGPQPDWAPLAHNGAVLGLALIMIGQLIPLLASSRQAVWTAWKAAGVWTVLALLAYWAGRTGSPLCRPSSAWQAHAAWHLFSAMALGRAQAAFGVGWATMGGNGRRPRGVVLGPNRPGA